MHKNSDENSISRVVVETTAMVRPGSTRGLGRYTQACVDAAKQVSSEVSELQLLPAGTSRLREFVDLAQRSTRLARMEVGIFHATNPYATALTRRPQVVSILDVIPLDVLAHRRTGVKANAFYALAARADAILTISEFSAQRIVELLRVSSDRVFVAPLTPVTAFSAGRAQRAHASEAEPFVFTVVDMATDDPRKRAYWVEPLALRLADQGVRLVVAGANTDVAFRGARNIRALGRVSDEALAVLYSTACCFCYFSAYEGQGLPPLEAMAAGAPVVAMSNSAVTEVVEGGGQLIDEPGDPWAASVDYEHWMEAALDDMATRAACLASDRDLFERQRRAALEKAEAFTWERFVRGLSRAYESVSS